ncbi:DUF7536 family protein [Haloparvum alkalitolerans]|uniref:DUF7536 family protein n=1 Tax=Haloparvum alkalitolerans TaxID=1042953 RepID=UPI003CE79D5D
MSEDRPGRPPLIALFEEFRVRRNAAVGIGVGVLVAVTAYLFRVLELWGPAGGTREYPVLGPEGWFLLLAFVLAIAVGLLVTAALTVATAVSRTRSAVAEDGRRN